MPELHRAGDAIVESLNGAVPDYPDFWTTPDGPTWHERWDRWVDETEVGKEIIRDDYNTAPKGAEDE